MVKKLSATNQLFSVAAKRTRAAQRDTREIEKAQREKMLDETILTPDRVSPPDGPWHRGSFAILDGAVIAEITAGPDSVSVEFADGQHTQVEFQNVDACKSLLTYRKIAVANMFPNGAVNLANMVRQRDAEAGAAQLRAVTDPQNSTHQPQVRL